MRNNLVSGAVRGPRRRSRIWRIDADNDRPMLNGGQIPMMQRFRDVAFQDRSVIRYCVVRSST
jgi:hypothetical protein